MGANLAAEYCVGCYHCVDSTVASNFRRCFGNEWRFQFLVEFNFERALKKA